MKLSRLAHDPAQLIEFFEDGLAALGAVCDRSWHDQLGLLAEGKAASLWRSNGELVERNLRFLPADAAGDRDADGEVFPGCPLTFRLSETLRGGALQVERAALQPFDQGRPPLVEAVEKLWHAQFPGCRRWRIDRPFQTSWHFSLLLLARCEIQAIDQHWSLHRLAFSLSDGRCDGSLAEQFDFAQVNPQPDERVAWPALDLGQLRDRIGAALTEELAGDLAGIRARQDRYLRRELDRVDDYFDNYELELQLRTARSHRPDAQPKLQQRLAAARTEHERRRNDQVQRHEIRVIPHVDALLLLAEPGWATVVSFQEHHHGRTIACRFLPRARRWFVDDAATIQGKMS